MIQRAAEAAAEEKRVTAARKRCFRCERGIGIVLLHGIAQYGTAAFRYGAERVEIPYGQIGKAACPLQRPKAGVGGNNQGIRAGKKRQRFRYRTDDPAKLHSNPPCKLCSRPLRFR
jgi:hypothetical protein